MKLKFFIAMTLAVFSVQAFAAKMVVSKAERRNMMSGARIWENPGDVASKDMLQGPGNKFVFNQDLNCKFYDGYYPKSLTSGASWKFWCAEDGKDPNENDIKVKYREGNGEVFGEVVSSRLLWALGFFADKVYPIHVNCENCPDQPWEYLQKLAEYKKLENSTNSMDQDARNRYAESIQKAQARRQKRNDESMRTTGKPAITRYEVATSEDKYPGLAIYQEGNEKAGVGLNEMDAIREESGGSSRAEIDALRLLLAFIKHGDNKPENQRLVCPKDQIGKAADGSETCLHPHLVIQDLGATFGSGATKYLVLRLIDEHTKLDYEAWRKTPLWLDAKICKAKLNVYTFINSMANPQVSEAGRKMLADLLSQLTDKQIADMFIAARSEQRQEVSKATIPQWVDLFKSKRAEIVNAHCPR